MGGTAGERRGLAVGGGVWGWFIGRHMEQRGVVIAGPIRVG